MKKAISYLDLNIRCCSSRWQCLVQFDADCCCAADSQQRNCEPCSVRPAGRVADYVCMCGRRLYIVEVTERKDAWSYKAELAAKYRDTKSAIVQHDLHHLLADVFVIVSRDMKLSDEVREYFRRHGVIVRLVSPPSKICA